MFGVLGSIWGVGGGEGRGGAGGGGVAGVEGSLCKRLAYTGPDFTPKGKNY